MRGRPGELPVLDLVRTRTLRLTLALSVRVDERVRQDPEQPGLEIRPLLELMEGRVRLREGLLHQVLGIRRVPCHAEGGGVQLIQERQHVRFEALTALLERLWNGTHPLSLLVCWREKTVREYPPGAASRKPARPWSAIGEPTARLTRR